MGVARIAVERTPSRVDIVLALVRPQVVTFGLAVSHADVVTARLVERPVILGFALVARPLSVVVDVRTLLSYFPPKPPDPSDVLVTVASVRGSPVVPGS
jgi:hypothetical protein